MKHHMMEVLQDTARHKSLNKVKEKVPRQETDKVKEFVGSKGSCNDLSRCQVLIGSRGHKNQFCIYFPLVGLEESCEF